jgi:voltage-gated potassium channel
LTGFDDALWWALSTTTTVGYGDIYPETTEGRLVALMLMLTGIGVIGVFTGSIASLFMIEEEAGEFEAVKRRLDTIEAKLDSMMAESRLRPPRA